MLTTTDIALNLDTETHQAQGVYSTGFPLVTTRWWYEEKVDESGRRWHGTITYRVGGLVDGEFEHQEYLATGDHPKDAPDGVLEAVKANNLDYCERHFDALWRDWR